MISKSLFTNLSFFSRLSPYVSSLQPAVRRVNVLNFLHLNGYFSAEKNLKQRCHLIGYNQLPLFVFLNISLWCRCRCHILFHNRNLLCTRHLDILLFIELALLNSLSRRLFLLIIDRLRLSQFSFLAQLFAAIFFMWEKVSVCLCFCKKINNIFHRCTTNQHRQQFLNYNSRFILFLHLMQQLILIYFLQPSRAPFTIITK